MVDSLLMQTMTHLGRVFAGSGGSRVGLERALFGSGTRSMIAPLWDVNQSSALDFLRTLYAAWAAGPGQVKS
jgi:CHAT domain-containing protein